VEETEAGWNVQSENNVFELNLGMKVLQMIEGRLCLDGYWYSSRRQKKMRLVV